MNPEVLHHQAQEAQHRIVRIGQNLHLTQQAVETFHPKAAAGNLWEEWQDRRRTLRHALESLQAHNDVHIANLNAALTIIAKVGILYNKLERSDQKDLLRQMVERVVVNLEGMIIRLELLPPFSYLRHVTERVQTSGGSAVEGKTKTSTMAGQRSSLLSLSDPGGTRTHNLLIKSQLLCQLSYGARM